jgi:hypothetical protein
VIGVALVTTASKFMLGLHEKDHKDTPGICAKNVGKNYSKFFNPAPYPKVAIK